MDRAFTSKRTAALALLNLAAEPGAKPISAKTGSFLGKLVAQPPESLTPAQSDWLAGLLERANLPPLEA